MIRSYKITILSVLCAEFMSFSKYLSFPAMLVKYAFLISLTSLILLHLNFHLEYILMERTRQGFSFYLFQNSVLWTEGCFEGRMCSISWLPLWFQGCISQFSGSVVSDSLWPHGLQHARPSCPSPTPGVYPDSCPLSQWCHPTISSSVVPFSSCPQSFQTSGSFQMSQLFASGGQSIGGSASTSVFQWTPRTDLLQDGLVGAPCSPRDSQESSPTPQFKSINSLVISFLHSPILTPIHDYRKNHICQNSQNL